MRVGFVGKCLRDPVSKMLLYVPRDLSSGRPMHITQRVHKGIRYLRFRQVGRNIPALAKVGAERRMTIPRSQTMNTHIHQIALVRSRKALQDRTRYVFGLLAWFLNKLNNRSEGQVFTDRFASRVMRSRVDAWNVLG